MESDSVPGKVGSRKHAPEAVMSASPRKPIIFDATLSVAHEVAYNPGACGGLQGEKTVQDAIGQLASMAHIEMVGGDGQDATPGNALEKPMQVSVSSKCGLLAGAVLRFEAKGNGIVAETKPALGGATASIDIPSPSTSLRTGSVESLP